MTRRATTSISVTTALLFQLLLAVIVTMSSNVRSFATTTSCVRSAFVSGGRTAKGVIAGSGARRQFSIRSATATTPALLPLRGVERLASFRLFSASASSSSSDGDQDDGDDDDKKKRVVFLGTPDVAASSLKTIHDASNQPESNFEIVGVVTQPPKRRRRKGKLEPSPVGKIAEELGIPVMCPEKAKDPDFLDDLEGRVKPHLCITAAYGQYLPKRFLSAPEFGTVNIHPSLLPRWRGASPVQRSLEAGENPVGVSVLFTVSKMDAGPIIAAREKTIDDDEDTATTVLPMLFELGTELLLENMPDLLDGTINMDNAAPQDENEATKADMIHSSEGEFKVWEESARSCHNRLRGFSMWPGAYMYLKVGDDGETIKVKVIKTRVVSDGAPDDDDTKEPSDVVKLGPTKKSGLYVECYDGSVLELLIVQPATRKAFPARDFQNGYPGQTIRWIKTPDEPDNYISRPPRGSRKTTATTATATATTTTGVAAQ